MPYHCVQRIKDKTMTTLGHVNISEGTKYKLMVGEETLLCQVDYFLFSVRFVLKMLEYIQENKLLNRSQLTYVFNWYHMTSQFNITFTSVRGHPCVSNPQLLPRNVERVIFSVYVGPTLCYLFQLQNKQREHLLTEKNNSQGRGDVIQRCAGVSIMH